MLKLFKKFIQPFTKDIHPQAKIGKDSKVHNLVFIEGDVKIGSNCVIKPLVFICSGTTIGDFVFIGPGTTFCNDRFPAAFSDNWRREASRVEDFASIGANCTILPGVRIGRKTLIGAGSVVTKDVPDNSIAFGNPAKILSKGEKNGTLSNKNG